MSKKAKTTIMCDVCHKPIVEDVNTDVPWYCMSSASERKYYRVSRTDGEGMNDCCSMACVIKELESRITAAQSILVQQETIHFEAEKVKCDNDE